MAVMTSPTPNPPTPEAPLPGKESGAGLRGRLNDLSSGAWRTKAQDGGSLVALDYPNINLVSPRILDELAARQLVRKFALALVGVLVLLAAAWGWGYLQTAGTQSELSAVQAQVANTQSSIGHMAPVNKLGKDVTTDQNAIGKQLQAEAYTSRVIKQFLSTIPRGVTISTYSLSMLSVTDLMAPAGTGTVNASDPCGSSPNPFQTSAKIGCIRFQGSAATYDLASHLVNHIAGTYLSEAYVGGVQGTTTGWTFSGSVAIEPTALSARYKDGTTLKQGLINGTIPAPTATAAPTPATNGG